MGICSTKSNHNTKELTTNNNGITIVRLRTTELQMSLVRGFCYKIIAILNRVGESR